MIHFILDFLKMETLPAKWPVKVPFTISGFHPAVEQILSGLSPPRNYSWPQQQSDGSMEILVSLS